MDNELLFQPQEQTELAPVLAMPVEINHFEELLQGRLTPAVCAKPAAIIQNVILAALEASGVSLSKPEILVEAAAGDPDISAEILGLADKIISRDIQ
ncbi:MAG: hypothetical protein LBQ83_02725 [Candidatus Margulisbacteria bacterium]|jgi:hypothetical protein|nr:hypothetical protein [Candidatus Margulisiibacteriota bacterium]